MKIFLLGKSGMLGSCFLKHLAGDKDFEMFAFGREDLNVVDSYKLENKIRKLKPTIVINCSAYTNVDGAETEKELALKINGEACGVMAKACNEVGAVLIHFSTDYVFDGKNILGYREDDEPHPLSIYGQSKLLGEQLIKQNTEQYYIVRTSWLYGENGKNFVDTMLELAKSKKELKIVGDQVGAPTYTNDLCLAVIQHFVRPYLSELKNSHEHQLQAWENEKINYTGKKCAFGTYHLTNSGSCSWYDFAKKIFETAGIKISLNKITSDELQRPASRPKCSILINSKLPKLRAWQEALQAYV